MANLLFVKWTMRDRGTCPARIIVAASCGRSCRLANVPAVAKTLIIGMAHMLARRRLAGITWCS
jgi:hypothetical protein